MTDEARASSGSRDRSRGRIRFYALTGAVAVGLVVRFLLQAPVFVPPDGYQNLLIARSLATGAGFNSGGGLFPDLSRPPLLPAITAVVSWVTGDPESAAVLLTMLASAMVVVPLFFLVRRSFGDTAGYAVLPLGALSALIPTAGRYLSTPLFILLGLSAAALTWTALKRLRPLPFFLAGVLAGATALARFEGLVLVAAMALWAAFPDGHRVRLLAGRARPALLLLAGFMAVYAPYAAWVSLKLERFNAAPGIRYLQQMRSLSDEYGLRRVEGTGVHWARRAQFMTTADHGELALHEYFRTGTIPDPDPDVVATREISDALHGEINRVSLVRRRAMIFLINLSRMPGVLYRAGLLPVVPVLLGCVGLVYHARRKEDRKALLFVLSVGAVSFSPLISHLETRFCYLPFAFGLAVAAAGWALLDRLLPKMSGARGMVIRITAHTLVTAAVLLPSLGKQPRDVHKIPSLEMYRKMAVHVSAKLPPGPVLAMIPTVPYHAGRPHRPIPYGSVETVLAYARIQGAVGLFVDADRDLWRTPQLASLTGDSFPADLRLLHAVPTPAGGEARLFLIEPEDAPAHGEPSFP